MTDPKHDFDRLETIMRMMTPSTFVGGYQSDITKKEGNNLVQTLLEMVYQAGSGGGVYTIEEFIKHVSNQVSVLSAGDPRLKEFNRVITILGPESRLGPENRGPSWPYLAQSLDSKGTPIEVKTTADLFGKSVEHHDALKNKPFSIITINSPLISPQRRDAEKVELFLNSIPGIVMSRCVPYVELEFGFNRPGTGTPATQLQTMSLLKFLLGADTSDFGKNSANQAMIDARRISDGKNEYSTAGMEMFTSPQALVNLDPVSQNSRYVDVLDPMRPFASLTSVTIDVKPTVGVYSYKKANVQFKLHDRSRLSEIADLVRPQVYTNTTVWLTYGWRHPFEPDNPYAVFINNNMLKREAYGVQNAQFSFDQNGQVDVNIELYTKGSSEVRSAKISQNLKEYTVQLNKVEKISKTIGEYRTQLGLDSIQTPNVEIRGISLLNAAGEIALPDFAAKNSKTEIKNAIDELERGLEKNNNLDSIAIENLITGLKELYLGVNKEKPAFFELDAALKKSVTTQMDEVRTGVDPYLVFSEKDELRKIETGVASSHPYVEILKNTLNDKTSKSKKRHYASFAKMFSIFIGNALMTIPGVDEIQTIFYQFNSKAGKAAGTNIAEFPINIDQFNDAYTAEIEQRSSDAFTIEEFLQLMIRTQIDDIRSIAYGYSEQFENYNKRTQGKGKSGKYESSVDDLANVIGPFQKPQIEVFVETAFAVAGDTSLDLLSAMNSVMADGSVSANSSARANQFKRVLRVHIYDRTLNPYESATKILSNGKGSFIAATQDWVSQQMLDDPGLWNGIKVSADKTLGDFIKQTEGQGSGGSYSKTGVLAVDGKANLSNRKIKEFVARSIPSIIYGTNASTIISANLATKQDPLLTAAQLTGLNKNKVNVMEPNGSGIKGLPLRVIPAQLSLTTLGCPLINYCQFFFVDFNTGTSLDNVYGVTGLVHTIVPGKFESNISFGFYDAYGKFETAASTTVEEFTALVKPPEKS